MRNIRVFLLAAVVSSARAEIKPYQETDNAGLNKLERIGVIEKFLVELSGSLRGMERKLDEQESKIKSLQEDLKEGLLAVKKEGEKRAAPEGQKKVLGPSEEEKLKADVAALKSYDIEKMKREIERLDGLLLQLEGRVKR